ncbi:MAG: DMT family transporter [Akkermansiaceae bacterium]
MSEAERCEKSGVLQMLGSVVLFTVNTLLVRWLSLRFPDLDGWQVTLFRGLAGVVLVWLLFTRGRGLEAGHLVSRPLVVLRGLLGACGIYLYYLSIIHLGAGRAVIINLTYPIFASIIAAVFLKEALSKRKFTWIIAGFCGLIVFLGDQSLAGGVSKYDLLALLGAIFAAAVVVLIRKLHHTEHTSTIYAAQCVYGALLAIPFAAPDLPTLPLNAGLWLLAAGGVVTFGQLWMTQAYRHLDVSTGASIQMLLPICTAVGGYFLFQERFTTIELSGAILTLLATYQVMRKKNRSS